MMMDDLPWKPPLKFDVISQLAIFDDVWSPQVLGSQKKFRLEAISAHLVHPHSFDSFEELNAYTSSKNTC